MKAEQMRLSRHKNLRTQGELGAVDMRSIHAGKRPGGDDDMVCGLDVCDELNEYDACVNDCEGDYTDEVTGATLPRDDVAKARAEEMALY